MRGTPKTTPPACGFCGAPDATDVYREEDYPDVPCCADEDACWDRRIRDESTDAS
jgi:hypothetical protein